MKKIYLILSTLVCGIMSYAQDISTMIVKTDSIKTLYGIEDQRYLDALTDVIQNLYDNKDYKRAYTLRKEHCNIVYGKYGADSYEYAEDMFRLGNVATHACSEHKALEYYLCALNAFVASSSTESEYYYFCLSRISDCYRKQNYNDSALYYNNKYVDALKNAGKEGYEVGYAYAISGDICFNSQNYEKAQEYYFLSRQEMESVNTMDEDDFSLYYYILWQEGSSYYYIKDYQSAISSRLQLSDIVKRREGQSHRYAETVAATGAVCLASESMEDAIKYYTMALNSLKNIFTTEDALMSDNLYRSILSGLSGTCYYAGRSDDFSIYTDNLIDAMSFVGDTLSMEYLETLERKFSYCCSKGKYIDVKNMLDPLDKLIIQYNGYGSDEYELFLRNAYDVNLFTFDYDSALLYSTKYNEWAKKIKGEESIYYAIARYASAVAYNKKGANDKALAELQQCEKILENVVDSPDKASLYTSCYEQHGLILSDTDPLSAAQYIINAIEMKKHITSEESAFVTLKTNLGLCYANAGDYGQALAVFNEVAEFFKSLAKKPVEYLYLMNNIGLCQINLGRLAEGAAVIEQAAMETKQNFGIKNELYMAILQNQTIYYSRIFDFSSAIKTAEQAADIAKEIFGPANIKYGMALQNLGFLYQNEKKYDNAENVLLEASAIMEKACGVNHIYNASIYHNLGNLYFEERRFDEADSFFEKSRDILLSLNKNKSLEMAALLLDYGRNLLLLNHPKSAEILKGAKELFEELGLEGHPAFLQLMAFCLGASFVDSNTFGDDLIKSTVNALSFQYSNNISIFTSLERQSYWTRMNNIKSLLFSRRKTQYDDIELYNYLLISKGLLLGTYVSFESLLTEIPDKEVLSDFSMLKSMKAVIQQELSRPKSERIQYLDSLISVANILERKLIFKSKEYGDYSDYMSTSYTDVIKALDKHEIAVEFVNYNDFSGDGSEVYAAMLTRRGWSVPKFIRLCNSRDLEDIVSKEPGQLYSQGFVADKLYQAIWAPIENYIKKGETIYFSPSGILYKLAVESVCNRKGQRIGDLYDMRRYSSTRNIISANKSPIAVSSAVLYGGIIYDKSETDNISESSEHRAGWEYLSGTKTEVETIGALLGDAGIYYETYEGEHADEESFNALSGRNIDVLHIATHGFFVSEEFVRRSDFYMNRTSLRDIYGDGTTFDAQSLSYNAPINDEAMLRSGLILAGGNETWTGAAASAGINDGVLTASEISFMNLSKTELVVLSACETGLGEVSDEGVLGLQRAFKNAGAQTLIMSLWKVDDHATSLLMTDFYKNLISGKTKREAFNMAQSALRKKCKEPFYWAAFIMLD